MIYFTSDTHFGHTNVIRLCQRPFSDVGQMNNALITNWNRCVTPDDEIYILGDFAYRADVTQLNSILSRLQGKKYLIRGNHDTFLEQDEFDGSAFIWIRDYYVLQYQKRSFVLFHYPILEWQGYFRDAIHLYGHIHNSGKDPAQRTRLKVLGNRAFNVGVDVNQFSPVSIETIIKVCDR